MRINRRFFLGVASALTSYLYSCRWKKEIFDSGRSSDNLWKKKEERIVATVCDSCEGGCGITVRVVDDIPVSIEGNPFSPVNRGTLCPQAFAIINTAAKEHTFESPMLRKNGKDGKLSPISWDEALQILTGKLAALKGSGNTHQILMLNGAQDGTISQLFKRFMTSYGSPNYFRINDNHQSLLQK